MSAARGTRATSIFLATLLVVAYPAVADVVENDILAHNGNETIAPGETLVVSYSITSMDNDKQDGCNAADGTPATLLIEPSSPDVTATPSSLTFTACGESQSVSLTSSVAGNYRINLEVLDAGDSGTYAIGGATFTLHVGASDPIILDTTAPTWTVPESAGGEATGPDGLAVAYDASASDETGLASSECAPPSGSTFPVGATTVTCTATDAAGNVGTAAFTVTVTDSTAPALTLPADMTLEAAGPDGASATFTASAMDIVDGAVGVDCAPPSGSMFPLGATTVTCTATDAAGNTATGGFTVTVQDTTMPVLSLPADLVLEATGPDGAAGSYDASALDLVDGALAPDCAPPSGSTFPLGATTVSCSATDAAGNPASGSFTVTVQDTTAPSLSLPSDMTLEATGPGGAAASWTASASDLVDGSIAPTCSPVSGSTFALGATTVICSAMDSRSNMASGSFLVTVQDTTPPALSLPADMTLEATGPGGAAATYAASALDIVDGAIAPLCAPVSGGTFALGTTTVTCSATDAAGNTAAGSFTITVVDTTPPAIAPQAAISADATSGSGASVSYAPTASDIVDGPVAVTCAPPSGSHFALGTTTVTCSATDAAGNTASMSFDVTVALNCLGPLAPIKLDGRTNFKLGSTIPIKCLPQGGSAGVGDATIRLSLKQVNSATPTGDVIALSTSAADTGNVMRWDATGQQYIYNLATKPLSKGMWEITMDMGGGNLKVFRIGLR